MQLATTMSEFHLLREASLLWVRPVQVQSWIQCRHWEVRCGRQAGCCLHGAEEVGLFNFVKNSFYELKIKSASLSAFVINVRHSSWYSSTLSWIDNYVAGPHQEQFRVLPGNGRVTARHQHTNRQTDRLTQTSKQIDRPMPQTEVVEAHHNQPTVGRSLKRWQLS